MITVCAPAPLHLDDAYALFCSNRHLPWSKTLFESALYKPFSLVALDDLILIGCIVFSHVLDEAELEDICVDSAYRKQGIASNLLETSIASLSASGIVKLHLEVRQSNENAIRLYERFGFVKVGERKAYYSPITTNSNSESTESALLYNLCLD